MEKFLLILLLTGCSSSVTVYGRGDSGLDEDALVGSGGTSGASGASGAGGSASEDGGSTDGSSGADGSTFDSFICETVDETCRRISGNMPTGEGASCGAAKNNCGADVSCGECVIFADCTNNICQIPGQLPSTPSDNRFCTYSGTIPNENCDWYQCNNIDINNLFGCQYRNPPYNKNDFCCPNPS